MEVKTRSLLVGVLVGVIAVISLTGILFFCFRDLDQTVSFQLPSREINIVTVSVGHFSDDKPATDHVINGGVEDFFREPVGQVIAGRFGDQSSREIGLVGFASDPSKTYFVKEKLGWSQFQKVEEIARQSQTLTVALGKDKVATSSICIVIFFAGTTLCILVFNYPWD